VNVRDCATVRRDGQRPCPAPWRPFACPRARAPEALPTFSFYTGPGFFDVACPTATDWSFATGKSFDRAPLPRAPDVPFKDKQPLAMWRGSLTGPGNEYESNARVALLMQPPTSYVDAAATGSNADRDRVDCVSGRIVGSAAAARGGHLPTSAENFVPFDEQAERCRYAIVLHGHGAADRMHPTLSCNQVMLMQDETSLVMSPWTVMRDILRPSEHYVSLRHVSEAADVIRQLESNRPLAQSIAQAARRVWNERLTMDGILDWWEMALHALPVTAREARRAPQRPPTLRNIRVR